MAKFIKGQAIAVIGMWTDTTVYIERAFVHSCGTKVLRIERANGQTKRFAYDPNAEDRVGHSWHEMAVVKDGTDDEVIAKAVALAKAYFARTVEHCKTRRANPSYNQRALEEQIAMFEDATPVVIWK